MIIDNIAAVKRVRALREDQGLSMQEMADATGRSLADYMAMEGGQTDPSFTFISKCADALGVDVIELLTGEAPHLSGYSLVRNGAGMNINRHESFTYEHLAPRLKNRDCEPFLVTVPYNEADATGPLHLSYHEGHEFDYILSGRMRFQYEDHFEELGPGDTLLYDSGRGHGIAALDGEPCTFIALVMKPRSIDIR